MIPKPKIDSKSIFLKYFPENSVEYAFALWKKYDFHFKITKSRKSKLGDYRYTFADKSHTITVNGDLNKYSFLITYLHEVAHLITRIEKGNKALPHGKEWKLNFKEVSTPVLNQEIFPEEVLEELKRYLSNPAASTCSDDQLLKILGKHDKNPIIYLDSIPLGSQFSFKGRLFIKLELNRTRFICQAIDNGRKYLISKSAPIKSN